MIKEKPNLPIIILNWNGSSDTIECIDSVLQSDYDDFLIYLIDNHSETEDYDKLYALYQDSPNVELIRYETNLGFAKAHNKIWEEVLSDLGSNYIFLLNNDTVIKPNTLSEITTLTEKNSYDCIACKMVDYYSRNTIDNNGLRVMSNGEILPLQNNHSIQVQLDKKHFLGPSGGAAIYKTSMLKKLGFFDAWFDTGYEDAEFSMRALLAGYKCGNAENAIVLHKGSRSIKKVRNESFVKRAQRNILYTNYKLLPIGTLILALIIGTLRTLVITILLFFTLKWHYVRIILGSRLEFYTKDMTNALQARKSISVRNGISIWQKCNSLIRNDLQRFKDVFLRGNSSALDM